MVSSQTDNASQQMRIAFLDQANVVNQFPDLAIMPRVTALIGRNDVLFIAGAEQLSNRQRIGRYLHRIPFRFVTL